MKNTDDEPRRLSFKDFTVVDYVPGEGQYINYQAQKRHRGTVGEEVEHLDEKVRPLEMTQAKYDSYPKNKKGKSGGKLYIIQNQKSGVTKGGVKFTSLGGGAGTTKVPVKIVKERPYKYEESVESVDEGVLNDIRDFIVAVGAAIPTKKNKRNTKDKALEDQIRMAMEADPEFDKIVRSVVFVRKDGVAAFKQGGRDKLDKYVFKTVDAKVAAKLGTLQKGYIRTMASGEKRNLGQNPRFNKGEKKAKEQGKIVYGDDMSSTQRQTTHDIGKIIKQVAKRAYDDAKKEQKNESVEQTDEMSNRLLNRYSDAAKKDSKKDRAKGMRKARNIRTQRANKGLFGSDIGEEVEQTDEGRILDKLRFKNKKEPNRGPADYIKAGETHDIGGTKVKFTKAGNQGHIGYSWKKSNGKEGYEEYHPKRFKNHDEVKANIASEIKSQSKQRKGSIERPRGRESVEQVDEAFTVAQRIKAKQRMKKMSKRIQMAKKRSMKRAPTPEKLKLRAKKQVKNALVSKWMRGKSKSDLSFSQRQNIEKRLKSASGRIDNMTKKLLPVVRKQDRERRANANSDKKEES